MKLTRHLTTVAVTTLLALSSCQTPLYQAVRDNNSVAVRSHIAAGADPNETSPSNWWWKAPMLPLTLAVDIFFWGADIIGDSTLTGWMVRYGSVTPVEEAMKWQNWTTRQAEICYTMALSGKVYNSDFSHACLSHAFSTASYDMADKLMARGVRPQPADLATVLRADRYDYADLILSKGIKPDSTHLRIVLDKNNYTYATTLLQKGASMDSDMLVAAIKAGDATKARFLVKAGMNVNSPLRENSYQFIAQEAGQLPLYRSLGGIVVAQPEAPAVDCLYCEASGRVVSGSSLCLACFGSGKQIHSSTTYTENGYAGCDPNDPNNSGYTANTTYSSSSCSSCGGSGRHHKFSDCPRCKGRGKVSRYLPQ